MTFRAVPDSRYILPMAEKFICSQCDQDEIRCACEKYCILCQAMYDVRLCADGAYYCRDCRESCDFEAQY